MNRLSEYGTRAGDFPARFRPAYGTLTCGADAIVASESLSINP